MRIPKYLLGRACYNFCSAFIQKIKSDSDNESLVDSPVSPTRTQKGEKTTYTPQPPPHLFILQQHILGGYLKTLVLLDMKANKTKETTPHTHTVYIAYSSLEHSQCILEYLNDHWL